MMSTKVTKMNESFALPAGRYLIGDYGWILDELREVVSSSVEGEIERGSELTFVILNDFADRCMVHNAAAKEPNAMNLGSRSLAILPEYMFRESQVPTVNSAFSPLIINTPFPFVVNVNNLSVEVKFHDRILFIDGHNVY